MPLPRLGPWDTTKRALHQSLRVLQAVRSAAIDPLPNELHHSVVPLPSGASTGLLPTGGDLRLDYAAAEVAYHRSGAEVFRVALAGHDQATLFDDVVAAAAAAGMPLAPARDKISPGDELLADEDQAAAYAEIQWRLHQVLARVKSRMLGFQTPIALWPHGFDLSTLWFPAGNDEETDAHVNVGFSPGTPDIGQPYCYLYAWPTPAGLAAALPAAMSWQKAWSTPGAVLPFDVFAAAEDPEAAAAAPLLAAYEAAARLLHGAAHDGSG